jgi:hypothetical protein
MSRVSSLWIAIAVLGSALLTGCGSASTPGATGTSATSAVQFAQCMRANGVPDFPDGPITPSSGVDPLAPAYQSAQSACERYDPPNASTPPVPASVRQQERALARCMRANGVTKFPDPDANGNIQFPSAAPFPVHPPFSGRRTGRVRSS